MIVGPGNLKTDPRIIIAGLRLRYICSAFLELTLEDTEKCRFGLLKPVTVIVGFLHHRTEVVEKFIMKFTALEAGWILYIP